MNSGILVTFNCQNLSYPVNKDIDCLGYVTKDMGDYVRFIDKHGIAYVVERNNVSASFHDTTPVYTVVGPFYKDTTTHEDKRYLTKFLSMTNHP